MTGFGIVFPIMPKYLEHFNGTVFDLGVMSAMWAVSAFITSPIMGYLIDKIGAKYVIILNLVGFALVNFLFAFAQNVTHLIILRTIEGGISSGVMPAAITLVSFYSSEETRSRHIGYVSAGSSIGIIIGPVIGGVLLELYSFTAPFMFSGALGLLGAVFAILYVPNKKGDGIEEKSLLSISTFDKLPKPSYAFTLFLFVNLTSALSWMLIEPGFSFYIYNVLLLTPIDFAIFVSTYGLSLALFQILLGGLSDSYGRKPIIFIGLVLNGLFYILMIYSTNLIALVLSSIVAGVALGMMSPALNAWITESIEPENRGFVLGLTNSSIAFAQIIGPLIGSYYYDLYGSTVMISLFIVGSLISLIGALVVIPTKLKTQPLSTELIT